MANDRNLFLDDKRMPSDAYLENLYDNPHDVYVNEEWGVAESYADFVFWIIYNGLPKIISFDHDLAPSHYAPKHLWTDYKKSKEWQEEQVYTKPTGADCAVWLVEYCEKNNFELPVCYCHSANPVGRDKILKILS